MEQRERLLALLEEALPGLRPLEEEDLPQVLALYQSNPEYNALALDSPPTLETCREDRTDLPPGRLPEHKLFLGYFQGERLAAVWDLVAGYPEESTLYLGLLELDGTHQRQGLGSRLVRALLSLGKEAGFAAVRLGCLEENRWGFAFWSKMGFTTEGRVPWKGDRMVLKMVRELEPQACGNEGTAV